MAKLPPPQSATVQAVMAAYEADAEDGFRAHLGASLIGKEGERALWLDFRWTTRSAFSGRMLRLPERFTIRTGWAAKGIRIKPARKNDLEASVRVLDDFMALQETGGLRRSRSGEALAVPVGARPTPRSVTRPAKFPGRLLEKPNHFIAPLKDDPQAHAVWRRAGRKGSKRKLMDLFADRVEIKPRFGFMDTVREVVEARFQENFNRALAEAITNAR